MEENDADDEDVLDDLADLAEMTEEDWQAYACAHPDVPVEAFGLAQLGLRPLDAASQAVRGIASI